MRKFSFLVLTVSFLIVFMVNLYAEFEKKAIADGVLRLHVVAESNSKRDQELKLKVRDAVLDSAKELFSDVKNKDEAIAVAKENIKVIKDAAQKAIYDGGKCLPVKVEVGKTKFPLKVYGNIRLPGGIYDAVNVKIGKAEGENWWCVMYPALCFYDAEGGMVGKDGTEKLINELGTERFRLITDTEDKKIRIKFKILELF